MSVSVKHFSLLLKNVNYKKKRFIVSALASGFDTLCFDYEDAHNVFVATVLSHRGPRHQQTKRLGDVDASVFFAFLTFLAISLRFLCIFFAFTLRLFAFLCVSLRLLCVSLRFLCVFIFG